MGPREKSMIARFQIWLSLHFSGITQLKQSVIIQITEYIRESYKQKHEYGYTAQIAGDTISA